MNSVSTFEAISCCADTGAGGAPGKACAPVQQPYQAFTIGEGPIADGDRAGRETRRRDKRHRTGLAEPVDAAAVDCGNPARRGSPHLVRIELALENRVTIQGPRACRWRSRNEPCQTRTGKQQWSGGDLHTCNGVAGLLLGPFCPGDKRRHVLTFKKMMLPSAQFRCLVVR